MKSIRTSWVETPVANPNEPGIRPLIGTSLRSVLGRARILSQVIEFSKRFFGFRWNSCRRGDTQGAGIRGALESLVIWSRVSLLDGPRGTLRRSPCG